MGIPGKGPFFNLLIPAVCGFSQVVCRRFISVYRKQICGGKQCSDLNRQGKPDCSLSLPPSGPPRSPGRWSKCSRPRGVA